MYTRPAQPLSMGGVLDDGFRLYKAAVKPLFALSFILTLVSQGPLIYLDAIGIEDPAAIASLFGPRMAVAFLAGWLLYMILFTAFIAQTDAIAAAAPLPFHQALGVGVRRMPVFFVTGIIYMFAVLVGILLLVVPGMFLSVSLVFAAFIVVIEGKGSWASLSESHRLVKGFWWRTATILTIGMIIAIVAEIVVGVPLGLAMESFRSSGQPIAWATGTAIVSSLLLALVFPLINCMMYCTYQDLRLRRQGSDLRDRLKSAG